MATLSETDYTRLSTSESETFTEAFYTALNSSRQTLSAFYTPSNPTNPILGPPRISFNGELLQDANVLQERFDKQMPWTHFEPQSVNAHVLNPSFQPMDGGRVSKRDLERNVSLTVQVSGYVRLVERKEGPMRGFSDSFVLVPNKDDGGGGRGGGKRFLIQSQHFRFVV